MRKFSESLWTFGARKAPICALMATTALAAVIATTGAAHAQAQQPRASELEEIVVTARKRSESLQSVPASVSAISEAQLKGRGITDLRDLSAAIPGINVNSDEPSRASVSIRGITTSSLFPTVGFYVDDVALTTAGTNFSGQSEPQLFDTQRVEVLKGPQGTLYGASSMGGAVKFVSNLPEGRAFTQRAEAEVSGTSGGGMGYSGTAVVNVPVVEDKLALRLGAYYREVPGYIDRIAGGVGQSLSSSTGTYPSRNTVNDDNVNEYRTLAGRAALGFTPDETMSAIFSIYYQKTDFDDSSAYWPNLPGLSQSNVMGQPGYDEYALPTLTLKKTLGDVEITAITGYYYRDRHETMDYTGFISALVPPFAPLDSENFSNTLSGNFSQELRIASADPAARLQYVAGLYYDRSTVHSNQNVFTYGSGPTSPRLPADDVFFGDSLNVTKQAAVFGEATFAVTPRLDLTAGGRAFKIWHRLDRSADGLFNGGLTGDKESDEQTGFSPKVELTYKFTGQNLAYLLANKGFRPGGGNSTIPASRCAADLAQLGLTTAPQTFQSDTIWNYEVGVKNTFLNGRVRANAAAFYIDWKNIQQGVNLPTCGFGFTGNVGAAVSKGVEGELQVSPVEGLTLGAAATYDDAKITEGAFGVNAVEGDPVIGSPKLVANLSAEYAFPLNDRFTASLRADYQYHGSQTQTFARTILSTVDPVTGVVFGGKRLVANPAYLQESYSVFNFNLSVRDSHWTARLFIDNAFNSKPLLSVIAGSNQTTAMTLRPRTIGLNVSESF